MSVRLIWRVLALSFCVLTASGAAAGEALRVLISMGNGMPMVELTGSRVTGGIEYDLAQDIGKTVRANVVFVSYPRKRIEQAVEEGAFDLLCHSNRKWLSTPDAYVWSEALYELKDVIVGSLAAPPVATVSNLAAGERVGTVLGFVYPGLEPLFEAGRLVRDDAHDESKILLKVSAGRTRYGLINTLTLDWYRRSTPNHRIADWRIVVHAVPIHCAIPKTSPWPPEVLLGAIQQLNKAGRVEKILSRYR